MRKLGLVHSHLGLLHSREGETTSSIPNKVDDIVMARPLVVKDYDDLVRRNAQILHRNRNITLFYRGQGVEHKVDGKTTILPSIYRQKEEEKHLLLKQRFILLEKKVAELKKAFSEGPIKFAGTTMLNKYPEIGWSILQHYEVCDTPLLDLTHSLHVASSFAFDKNGGKTGIVYVLGMPWATDSIGYNTYEEVVNIRLLSVCPPQAQRPFFQEGFLAGPFPNYRLDEPARIGQFDFARRLVAKFEIPIHKSFWGHAFGRIPRSKLFPESDKIGKICENLRSV